MTKVKINPDQSIVEAIRNRLKVTNQQCPCIPEQDWNDDTLCPCKQLRENQYCCCGLYITETTEETNND